MSAPIFPAQIQDPTWLNGILVDGGHSPSPVTVVSVDPLTMSGAFCEIVRLRLSYADAAATGPATLIVKIPRTTPGSLAIASALGLFERERRFYADLAPNFPIRTPRCYSPGSDDGSPLLIEDLGNLRSGNQIEGLSLPDIKRIFDALALMHARFWPGQGPDLGNAKWLISPDDTVTEAAFCQTAAFGVPGLRERYADRLPAEAIDGGERVSRHFADVMARCAEGPLTLVHGDARANNWMFDAEGKVALIDWQTPARARGTQDVAYLLCQNISIEHLQEHAWDLLRYYHDGLKSHGVQGYSWDDCVQHYRQHVLYSLYAAYALLGPLAGAQAEALANAMIMRNVGHAHAIGAFNSL